MSDARPTLSVTRRPAFVTARVEDALLHHANRIAEERGVSRSTVVRDALAAALVDEKQ